MGPVVFAEHSVLIVQELVARFNCVEFILELLDVLLLGQFHLLQNFFLGQKLAVQAFGLGNGFVGFMLELLVLFLQVLNQALSRAQLDLRVFLTQSEVFKVTLGLQELRFGGRSFPTFLFVTLNPHVTGLFFANNHLV